jgi:hypothetical protein
MRVMEQAIEEGGDGCGISEELAPIIDGTIRRQQRRRAFVAAHDQLEEIFSGGMREFAHAEIVDDEERDDRQFREVGLACARERRLGEFFEQRVRLAIHDAVTLQDGGAANGLGQVAFAGARRTKEEDVLALRDEAGGGELVDECPIHLLVEIKVKGIERALGIAKARQLVPALEQPVLSAAEFVGDERGDEIDGRHLVGLRLPQPRVEDRGHAGQPQLPQGAIEFNQIHH